MLNTTIRKRRTGLERVYRVRLENMRKIIEGMDGNRARLARALGVTPSFVTQVAGDHPIRTIGEKLARDIEIKLGLFSGWLDQIH